MEGNHKFSSRKPSPSAAGAALCVATGQHHRKHNLCHQHPQIISFLSLCDKTNEMLLPFWMGSNITVVVQTKKLFLISNPSHEKCIKRLISKLIKMCYMLWRAIFLPIDVCAILWVLLKFIFASSSMNIAVLSLLLKWEHAEAICNHQIVFEHICCAVAQIQCCLKGLH